MLAGWARTSVCTGIRPTGRDRKRLMSGNGNSRGAKSCSSASDALSAYKSKSTRRCHITGVVQLIHRVIALLVIKYSLGTGSRKFCL